MAPGRSRGLTKRAGFWHSHAIPPQLRIYSRSLPILWFRFSQLLLLLFVKTGLVILASLSCCSVPLFTVFNVSWTMRFDSGVCVKKISWLGWLCWSQTTIYVILSDIVLWGDIFLSSALSFSLNKTIFHAAAFVFCIIGTTIFAALCSSPWSAFASQYVGADTTVFHNTTLLYFYIMQH